VCRLRRLAALAWLLLLPASVSHATVVAGGNIINQTWVLSGSPYDVQGDITIPGGAFLRIEPGVEVRFASTDAQGSGVDVSRIELTVSIGATLEIDGTAAEPVRMNAQSSTSPSTWYGIVVENGASATELHHVIVKHAHRAVQNFATTGVLILDDSSFELNGVDLLLAGGGAPSLDGTIAAGVIQGAWTIPSGPRFELNRALGSVSGNFTLGYNATYRTTLSSTTSYRKLQVLGGSVTLAGWLELDVSAFTGSVDQFIVLIDKSSGGPVSGTFLGLPENSEFDAGAYRFRINYGTGPGSNDVRLTVVESVICDLALTKSAPAETLLAAGGLAYTLTVSNAGPGTAQAVSVRDSLPAGLRYLSASPSQGSCAEVDGVVTCSLGDLAVSASASIEIAVSFDFDTLVVVNAARATVSNTDSDPGNDVASTATRLVSATTGVAPGLPGSVPEGRMLWARPNPSPSATRIFFRATPGSRAELEIFDAAGRRVREMDLRVGDEAPSFRWDGRDSEGAAVGSGLYYYRVRVDGKTLGSERSVILR
jgi:uncharacterized repeat protein (TIGR01451 family)